VKFPASKESLGAQTFRFDGILMVIVGLLLAIGAVMVFSASVGVQGILKADSHPSMEMFLRIGKHLANISIGLLVLFVASFVNIRTWRRLSRLLFPLGIFLLVVLLVPGIGREVNGSTRWLILGPFGIQPTELVKVFVILHMADYFVRNAAGIKSFATTIIRPALPLGLITVLFLRQPDLGSAVVVLFVALGMMFLSGVRLYYLVGAFIAILAVLAVLIRMSDSHWLQRVLCFQDPWADATGCGYQLIQALIAVGSGEWFGVGLGSSVQKLFYLPHANNDFLVSVIAEELGFLGISVLIALYGALLWRIFQIARSSLVCGDFFSSFVAQGVGLLLAIQTMVHLAVNFGVVPTTGLTMPLMSAGGSSMVATCFAIGLLFSIDRSNQRIKRFSR
jgi:cell division protein FtsW